MKATHKAKKNRNERDKTEKTTNFKRFLKVVCFAIRKVINFKKLNKRIKTEKKRS